MEIWKSLDQTLGVDSVSGVADALDRLGERLVQECEDGGLAARVANLEERVNQLHMQLAGFNISRYVYLILVTHHEQKFTNIRHACGLAKIPNINIQTNKFALFNQANMLGKGRAGAWKILPGTFTSRLRAARSSAAIGAFSNTTKCRRGKRES